jgi:hypothetical protein
MTNLICKKLAAVTVGTALILGVGETMPAQAAKLIYNFSNTNKTLTGTFSFDQAAADDQQVTISEGLKIFATYGGQSYTEADDSLALVLTDFSGNIGNQGGLGLEFTPGTFEVYRENFIDRNDPTDTGVQFVKYTSVPEPGFLLGSCVFGLGLLVRKKVSSKSLNTKA